MNIIVPIAIFIGIFMMLMLLAHVLYSINDWRSATTKKADE